MECNIPTLSGTEIDTLVGEIYDIKNINILMPLYIIYEGQASLPSCSIDLCNSDSEHI